MKNFAPRTHFNIGVVVLLIASSVSCGNQADQNSSFIIEGETGIQLDSVFTPFCEGIILDYDLPGLAVGIVKDNEIVYARGFGYLDIASTEEVTMNSLFHMASISKPFVATAIMQLVEQGKMDLDSTVLAYLPYFKLEGGQYDQITIRQMLNHISGTPDVHDYEWDNPVYDEGALERYVHSISSEEMIAVPGETFAYSDMSFECLGDVIAKVSGLSFADYVKQNILDLSGMKESTFLKSEALPENWALPHIRFTRPIAWDGYPYNRMHGPSSTLHSNAMEMCNWAIINMKRGSYQESTILQASSYDLLWKPWFKTGDNSSIGLSWFLGSYRDEAMVEHGGGDTGFNTNLILLPEKSLAVVVMCNLSPAPVGKISDAALDILLGYEPASYKKPAIIPVCKELEQNGPDAAAEMWETLVANHAEEYDFNAQFLSGLITAVDVDRPQEAVRLTELYTRILDRESIEEIIEGLSEYLQEMPDNTALPASLKVFEEYLSN